MHYGPTVWRSNNIPILFANVNVLVVWIYRHTVIMMMVTRWWIIPLWIDLSCRLSLPTANQQSEPLIQLSKTSLEMHRYLVLEILNWPTWCTPVQVSLKVIYNVFQYFQFLFDFKVNLCLAKEIFQFDFAISRKNLHFQSNNCNHFLLKSPLF